VSILPKLLRTIGCEFSDPHLEVVTIWPLLSPRWSYVIQFLFVGLRTFDQFTLGMQGKSFYPLTRLSCSSSLHIWACRLPLTVVDKASQP